MLMFYIFKKKIKARWEGKWKSTTENKWKQTKAIVFPINTTTTLKWGEVNRKNKSKILMNTVLDLLPSVLCEAGFGRIVTNSRIPFSQYTSLILWWACQAILKYFNILWHWANGNVWLLLGATIPIWESDIKIWNGGRQEGNLLGRLGLEASVWLNTHTHTYLYIYTHKYIDMYIFACVYIYNMYTCIIFVCICVNTCIFFLALSTERA